MHRHGVLRDRRSVGLTKPARNRPVQGTRAEVRNENELADPQVEQPRVHLLCRTTAATIRRRWPRRDLHRPAAAPVIESILQQRPGNQRLVHPQPEVPRWPIACRSGERSVVHTLCLLNGYSLRPWDLWHFDVAELERRARQLKGSYGQRNQPAVLFHPARARRERTPDAFNQRFELHLSFARSTREVNRLSCSARCITRQTPPGIGWNPLKVVGSICRTRRGFRYAGFAQR